MSIIKGERNEQKSAKRRRKNLITKLAMTSALTLGVGAAATLAGQTEVRAEVLTLNMKDKAKVEEFANKLKDYAKQKKSGQITLQELSLILDGYRNIREQIEQDLATTEKTKNFYGEQLILTDKLYQSEKEKKEKLEAELQLSQQKIHDLDEKHQKEKLELQAQLEASNQKIKELEMAKSTAEAEINRLTAEKNGLQEKLNNQEKLNAELQAKLAKQEELNAKLQKEIDELMAQIEKLKHCQDTPKPEPKPMPEPKPEAKKPEQPKPMTKPGAKKPEQSLPSTGDIRNPFFTPAAIAIMIAAGTIAIPKRKKED